jgi:hypothetical protein
LVKTNKKKSSAIAGAAFVKYDHVLGGGCDWEIADMRKYPNISAGFKSADMLVSGKYKNPNSPFINAWYLYRLIYLNLFRLK